MWVSRASSCVSAATHVSAPTLWARKSRRNEGTHSPRAAHPDRRHEREPICPPGAVVDVGNRQKAFSYSRGAARMDLTPSPRATTRSSRGAARMDLTRFAGSIGLGGPHTSARSRDNVSAPRLEPPVLLRTPLQ